MVPDQRIGAASRRRSRVHRTGDRATQSGGRLMRRLPVMALVIIPLLPLGAQTPIAPIARAPRFHGQAAITTTTGVTHLDGLTIRDAAGVDGRVRAGVGFF